MPVAFSCSVRPSATEGLIGLIATAFSAAAVTASVALAETPTEVTVIVVEPGATAVARPVEGSIVATAVLLDFHPSGAASAGNTEFERSENEAFAVNCTVWVATATGPPGWTARPIRSAVPFTVTATGADVVPSHAAVIFELPAVASGVTNPE